MKLRGKVAIVTGASKGIGKSIAETFAREGCELTIVSRNLEEINAAASELKSTYGTNTLAMKCDVSNFSEVDKMVRNTVEHFKRIDILVNNAGVLGPVGSLVDNDLELWEETMNINLLGTVNCTKAVLPHMIKAGAGKIINFSGAGVGSYASPTLSAYVVSKHAIVAFTEIVAAEVKDYNIQVNSINPGAVDTRILDQIVEAKDKIDKNFWEKAKKHKETGGVPSWKVAELALYLASEDSDGITGKLLSVVRDDYKNFDKWLNEIKETSVYTLRRIDKVQYREVSK